MKKNSATFAESTLTKKIPLRSEIDVTYTWDLSPIFPDDQSWENALNQYKQKTPLLEATRGKCATSPESLAEVLNLEKDLSMLAERIGQYSGLRLAEDASNDANLARQAKLDSLTTRAAELSAHIRPEIHAIDDQRWHQFLEHPALADWLPYLKKLRRFKNHTLTPSEERLLALASEPLSGLATAFSQLTNVDMQYGTVTDEHGVEQPLTQSTLSSFLLSPSPAVRERAFRRFYAEISDHSHAIAALLAHSVKTDVFYARARNYPSARHAALHPDAVDISVYDNLITEVRNGLPALQEYYELRCHILGLAELHHYDTYVPLVPEFKKITPYEDAVELVVQSLAPLGQQYCDTLRHGLLDGRWVDRYETKGKRSGAFSWGCYGSPPYIMMNYKDDVFSDVYTLAHEAGHSMHSWLSNKHQRWQDAHYTIFAAEVASTFNEALLTHHLLQKTDDPRMRAYIISRQLDDIRSTLFRQTMFAEFEKNTHQMQEAGEPLTLGSIRSTYRKLLDTYLAPAVVVDQELELECLRIPHFYSAFYVYKYATGISAAIALSQRVLQGGPQEKQQYLNFLSLGGLLHPIDALKTAGVDMSGPEPVRAAIKLFSDRVAELRQLLP
jgi:oligoendopeptidase F